MDEKAITRMFMSCQKELLEREAQELISNQDKNFSHYYDRLKTIIADRTNLNENITCVRFDKKSNQFTFYYGKKNKKSKKVLTKENILVILNEYKQNL